MNNCDVAVIGAGPAGCMAAMQSSCQGKHVILIERNPSIGKKLRMTGKGRCNITNIADKDVFVEKFKKSGKFFITALFKFSNKDLIEFFKSYGLELVHERQGRVFPIDYKSISVIRVLEKVLHEKGVNVFYKTRIMNIKKEEGLFILLTDSGKSIIAKKVIVATGGSSYRMTGSSGDGYKISEKLGHSITRLTPGLVPLRTKETWVKDLKGIALKNVIITIVFDNGKKLSTKHGELMFTHFGISGPLALDLSKEILENMEGASESRLFIDLKSALTEEKLNARLIREFTENGKSELSNILKNLLPERLAQVFLKIAKIDPLKTGSQITQKERAFIATLLKKFPLTITGSLPLEEAMVTGGGVSLKEMNPRTMESKIVPGLYFAGEIIDGSAPSGGYNLQIAFSTGFLAGESTKNA